MLNLRKVERLTEGLYETVRMIDLKNGDTFKLTEPDGTYLLTAVAVEDAKVIDGVVGVSADIVDPVQSGFHTRVVS